VCHPHRIHDPLEESVFLPACRIARSAAQPDVPLLGPGDLVEFEFAIW
jgi:hypothetical protein